MWCDKRKQVITLYCLNPISSIHFATSSSDHWIQLGAVEGGELALESEQEAVADPAMLARGLVAIETGQLRPFPGHAISVR